MAVVASWYMTHKLRRILDGEHTTSVAGTNDLHNYIYRDPCLEYLSLDEFAMWYETRTQTNNTNGPRRAAWPARLVLHRHLHPPDTIDSDLESLLIGVRAGHVDNTTDACFMIVSLSEPARVPSALWWT